MSPFQILHASPGVMAHSSHAALALQDAGWLAAHLTTFAIGIDSPEDRFACQAACRVGLGKVAKEATARRTELVTSRLLQRLPWLELCRIVANRIDRSGVGEYFAWQLGNRWFDQWVASKVSARLSAVVGYERSCGITFRKARRLRVKTIYQMVAPYPPIADALVDQVEVNAGLAGGRLSARVRRDRPLAYRHMADEFATADGVVANSRYTADTLLASGYPADRVEVVPLGAPPVHPQATSGGRSGPLVALYAGRASPRKGAPFLLAAWRRVGGGLGELRLAGGWGLPSRPPADLEGFRYLGHLAPAALEKEYLAADLLVLPTVCDGFGMVVTEALAHGLPVLTTTAAGAGDLIRPGVNGFLIPPSDEAALADQLRKCLSDPAAVRAMRPAAAATAAANSWTAYRQRFVEAVGRLIHRPAAGGES